MRLYDLFNEDMTPNWDVFKKTFPEMLTSEHSKRWHKEGNAFEHTRLVYEEMSKKIPMDCVKPERYLIMMSAALLHDIGKPATTYWDEQKQDWCCKSHGDAGERLFRNVFMEERLDLREKVAFMIKYHMLLHYTPMKGKDRQEREMDILMHGPVPFEDMVLLNECDCRGSINEENNEETISKHLSEVRALYDKFLAKGDFNKWDYVTEDTPKLYIMVGIPGAGKSTYTYGLGIPVVSRDEIRADLKMCGRGEKCLGTKEQEDKVTKIADAFTNELLESHHSFAIDNTSLKKKYRDEYIRMAKKHKMALVYVYVEAPSLEDNYKRRYGQIDPDIIKRMWDNMEFPQRNECYEMRLIDQRFKGEYKF